MMLSFLAALLALLILALWKRQEAVGTAVVLLINWALLTTLVWVIGERFPWPMFVTVDYLCGLAVFAMRTTRWQSAIIAIYAVQCICHAAFGYSSHSRQAQDNYWWTLTLTGWAQLAVLGGWMIAGLARGADRAGGSASPDFATASSHRDQGGEA